MRWRSVADDLVQDCLERAVSRWDQRRADGDARTWMFTILHNLAISRFRQTVFRGKHLSLSQSLSCLAVDRESDDDRVQ